ncbi:unnamed protein product [Ectocarpus sp. 13 AM-2016]
MEQVIGGGGGGAENSTSVADAAAAAAATDGAASEPESTAQTERHSLPTVAVSGSEDPTAASPDLGTGAGDPTPAAVAAAEGEAAAAAAKADAKTPAGDGGGSCEIGAVGGGVLSVSDCGRGGVSGSDCGGDGGSGDGGDGDDGGGGGGGGSGDGAGCGKGGGSEDGAGAGSDETDDGGGHGGDNAVAAGDEEKATDGGAVDPDPSSKDQPGEHLSTKYTKEELMARHWGMNLMQMKRVKALLRMGVCEEDLEIADRLLKMGLNWSNDTPPTKEEQLLGYTSQQRQRMKALHILGLTEESFDRCRAVMLSSLGPSAFGYSADETAASAVSAEAEEGWTPGDKFRRRAAPSGGGGGHHHTGMLRMPTFSQSSHNHISSGNIGRQGDPQRVFSRGIVGSVGSNARGNRGGLGGLGMAGGNKARRASDSVTGGYHLPDINAGKKKPRGVGGGAVAAGLPPLGSVVGSPVVSTRTDPG